MVRTAGATALLVLLAAVGAAAVQGALTLRAIDEAIALGRTGIERDRVAFHRPYRLQVGAPPVDFIEVITPFRRVVLMAEQLARTGNRSFGQREALQHPDVGVEEIELRVALSFHPLNTYVGVPEYAVTLTGPEDVRIEPRTIDRTPRYTPRVEDLPPVVSVPGVSILPEGSQPILGGTVSARFDLRRLDPGARYEIVISEGEQELARATLDLRRLR